MVSENSETLVYQWFPDTAFLKFTSAFKTLEQCGFQRLNFLHFLVFRAFFFSWRWTFSCQKFSENLFL